jgi:Holliday junction resolvasome RuvABC endonuclease subunit
VSRRRKETPWILGIDPSLTRSAAVLIPPGWELGDWLTLRWCSVEIPPGDGTERQRVERMGEIVDRLLNFVSEHSGSEVRGWVEQYAFNARSASVTKLAELGGILRHQFLIEFGVPLEPVTASQARKQLLGKLPRKDQKLAVQLALGRAGAPFVNGDECDAACVAFWGLTEIGAMGFSLA